VALFSKEGVEVPMDATTLTWRADESNLKLEDSNILQMSKGRPRFEAESFLGRIRSSTMHNNLKYQGYFECSDQFSSKMRLVVSAANIHPALYSSPFFSKRPRVMLISSPEEILLLNNFLTFTVVILVIFVLVFIFLMTKAKVFS
jgi:hypothetical protein